MSWVYILNRLLFIAFGLSYVSEMTGTLNYKFDNALKLRSIITAHGTGGEMNDIEFRLLRSEFFDDPNTKPHLPRFVRDNVDGDGV